MDRCQPAHAKDRARRSEYCDFQNYWYELIGETPAAIFIGHSVRTLQGWRSKGGGPPFVKISGRDVKYRRCDLKKWADDRLRASTSDSDGNTVAQPEINISTSDQGPEVLI